METVYIPPRIIEIRPDKLEIPPFADSRKTNILLLLIALAGLAVSLMSRYHESLRVQRLLPSLTPDEYAGVLLANKKLALSIPPYFFNLIDPADENCPIRSQVVPRVQETHAAPWEMSDPCGEMPIRPCRAWCIGIPTGCCFW